jgi:uncharacterized protein DUF6585
VVLLGTAFPQGALSWPGILLLLVFLGIGLFWPVQLVRHLRLRVYLCPHGVMYIKGRRVEALRWDQVEWVRKRVNEARYGGLAQMMYKYTVRRGDGATFTFTNYLKHIEQLGPLMVERITRVMLPRLIETYQRGESVQFGNLTVSRVGLTRGSRTLSWAEFGGVHLFAGSTGRSSVNLVTIEKKSGNRNVAWMVKGLSTFPNYDAFVGLISSITTTHQ